MEDNINDFEEQANEQDNANKPDKSVENQSSDAGEDINSVDWKTIEQDPTKINIDPNFGNLAHGIVGFIRSTLSLRRQKYDYEKVVEAMKENIVFKGYNVWILICSIVVASIGLNMDSMAVVIGAMLISPLMGPIRGIGFGVGMNDLPLLMKSLKNFGVMVGISLVTSILYFAVSPIDIANSQLLARTEPNFLDAMIAFFGGLAGIIAATNGKNDTVVNGVAIATALMPPLCTAGFSLANGEWTYFLGSSYLFLLNSLFIALSTLVLIRYVGFPKIEYLSEKIERKVRNYIIIFSTIIIIPSGYLFYLMSMKSNFQERVDQFVEEIVKPTEVNMSLTYTAIFDRKEPKIELDFGNVYIDSTQLGIWNRSLVTYKLDHALLVIKQGEDINALTERKINEALGLTRDQNQLVNLVREKELSIAQMQEEFDQYKISNQSLEDKLDLNYFLEGSKTEYAEISKLTVNHSFSLNAKNEFDTTFAIAVRFKEDVEEDDKAQLMSRLNKRFCFELKDKCGILVDSVKVVRQ